jgi:hypothetical protein
MDLDCSETSSRRVGEDAKSGSMATLEGARPPLLDLRPPRDTRTKGVRHLMAAYDLGRDTIYGHVKVKKDFTGLSPRANCPGASTT